MRKWIIIALIVIITSAYIVLQFWGEEMETIVNPLVQDIGGLVSQASVPVQPSSLNPELDLFSVELDNGVKICYRDYCVTYLPRFVMQDGTIYNWADIPPTITKDLWKEKVAYNRHKYGADFYGVSENVKNNLQYVVLHRTSATKVNSTGDVVPMNKSDIAGRIKREGNSIILNNKVTISHSDVLNSYSIPVINKTDIVIGNLGNTWEVCGTWNNTGDCEAMINDSNWKLNSDGTYNISFDPTITLDAEEISDNSILVNVTAEVNFTHLDIDVTASPYNNLIGYWSFDADEKDDQVATHYDFTNYNNDGTGEGEAVVNDSTCIYGGCAHFDGSGNDRISVTDSGSPDLSLNNTLSDGYTVSFWIYPRDTGDSQNALCKGDWMVDGEYEYCFTVYYGDARWRGWTLSGSSTFSIVGGGFTEGTWNYITGVWSRDGLNVTLYVNGAYASSEGSVTSQGDGEAPLTFGARGDFGDNEFNGLLDEIMVFNTTLTGTQILDIYRNQSARFAETGSQTLKTVKLSEQSGDNTINISTTSEQNFGSNLTIRLGGANITDYTYYSLPKIPDVWLRLDIHEGDSNISYMRNFGNNFSNFTCRLDLNDCPNISELEMGYFQNRYFDGSDDSLSGDDYDILNNITILTWVNKTDEAAGGIVGKFTTTIADGEWGFGIDTTEHLTFDCGGTQDTSSGTITVNSSYHFVGMTFDSVSNEIIWYIDGTEDSTDTNTDTCLNDDTEGFKIGYVQTYGLIDGHLDDIMVFDEILTAEEIEEIYIKGGFNYSYSEWQNVPTNSYANFSIDPADNYTSIEYNFSAGNTTDPFYTPILWNLSIDYSHIPVAAAPEDTIYPIFSNYADNNGTLIDSGTAWFNTTILNSNGTALLEIDDGGGSKTNYSASNSSDVFNVTVAMTASGTYDYTWHSWGNGTSGNFNRSILQYYTVNASAADTTFSVTMPAGTATVVFNVTNKTYGNFPPTNQTDTVPIFNVSNDGNVDLNISFRINESLPASMTLKADTDNDPAGADTIDTSEVLINSTLPAGESCHMWLWTDFVNAVPQDIFRIGNISVKETS